MLRSRADGTARTRNRIGLVGALVAAGAYAALVPVTGLRASGARIGDLVGGGFGPLPVSAAVALALVLAGSALLLVVPGLRPRAGRLVAVVGSVIAMSSLLLTGHTRTVQPRWLMMGADLVHASTAAIWFGGLIGLAVHLAHARRVRSDPVGVAGVVSRFSSLAGASVGLLGVTGVVMAWTVTGSVRSLVTTDYGRTLGVKVTLAAVVALLAVWNKFSLVRTVRAGQRAKPSGGGFSGRRWMRPCWWS